MQKLYDETYIQPEYRSDWLVTKTIKKVWWIQLDLLKQLDNICKRHNLRWYPICGILIGVIRHQGCIPWDDDIDVAMPREDYNKFVRICQAELSEPYFLQTPLSDEDCYMTWVSLRNSNTTGNRISCMSKRQNNGIAIDIIPLEGCESNFMLYKIRRFPLYVASVICNTYVNEFNTEKSAKLLRKCLRKFKINYLKIYQWLEKQNSKHPWSRHKNVTMTLIADRNFRDLRRVILKKEDFESVIEMKFENTTIPVPCGYDRILRTMYHDYMKFPPINKREGKHHIIFEPDIPYKQYCAEHFGVIYN